MEEAEAEFGCDASVIPIEDFREKTEDEIWELLVQKRAERRKRDAARLANQ